MDDLLAKTLPFDSTQVKPFLLACVTEKPEE